MINDNDFIGMLRRDLLRSLLSNDAFYNSFYELVFTRINPAEAVFHLLWWK